ncbi:uncharacterized protein LOC129000586 [Macrosteles quadrilineatus]|uniref:uncharacterized protein LOC129000586 n=1 Tax=Macrosteles quadrilineatus TaxID=74068 RepID=UPI0023E2FEED|nr:uncharacterized protein LOC129000586 [Macrosteles quadrilineatus]
MYPSSSCDKQRKKSREGLTWSESVVRRRRAIARSESDSDTEAPTPPPFPSECLVPTRLPQRTEKKCSHCSFPRSNTSLRQSSKSYSPKDTVEKKTSNVTLQQLETKLYSAELENVMNTEKLEKVEKRLRRAAQLCEALLLYVQGVDLQVRAAARATQLMGSLAYKDLSLTGSLVQALDKVTQDTSILERLEEIQNALSHANEIPEHLHQLDDEFEEKRRNYTKASNSFGRYLRAGCNVSSGQLHKYENQWDSLRGEYERSRKRLEYEYSKLIDDRNDVLEFCFSKLGPIQEKLVEQDDKFSVLSKETAKSLREHQKHSRQAVSQTQNSKTHR